VPSIEKKAKVVRLSSLLQARAERAKKNKGVWQSQGLDFARPIFIALSLVCAASNEFSRNGLFILALQWPDFLDRFQVGVIEPRKEIYMRIQAIMLYFLSEEDVERFEIENCDPEERYFAGLLPQTTTHFISQDDFRGDEHSWLAEMGYDHEAGFDVTFSEQDGDDLRAALLTGLLENDYAVCAWPGRLLFQPNDYRIQRMVETDFYNAALRLSPDDLGSIVKAFDHLDDARNKENGEKHGQQPEEA
jgi:hypothetical protein